MVAVATDGNTLTVLGSLPGRCNNPSLGRYDYAETMSGAPNELLVDSNHGTAVINIRSIQAKPSGNNKGDGSYDYQEFVHRIHGLPNNFDILTTFTPDTTKLTWSSPFMPMGLSQRAADSFDVFRGNPDDLRTGGLAGFSAMEPVACGVGAEDIPEVGKRYILDLPARESPVEYYLVSANAGGEQRYGRWKLGTGGAIQGRNPGVMPNCSAMP